MDLTVAIHAALQKIACYSVTRTIYFILKFSKMWDRYQHNGKFPVKNGQQILCNQIAQLDKIKIVLLQNLPASLS